MKILLVIGNRDIESRIRYEKLEVVDSEADLETVLDLLNYIDIDGLVINRLLVLMLL